MRRRKERGTGKGKKTEKDELNGGLSCRGVVYRESRGRCSETSEKRKTEASTEASTKARWKANSKRESQAPPGSGKCDAGAGPRITPLVPKSHGAPRP